MVPRVDSNSSRYGIVVASVSFIGGLIFAISNIIDETSDWWLDTGFFASIISGIALILFAKLILSKIKQK